MKSNLLKNIIDEVKDTKEYLNNNIPDQEQRELINNYMDDLNTSIVGHYCEFLESDGVITEETVNGVKKTYRYDFNKNSKTSEKESDTTKKELFKLYEDYLYMEYSKNLLINFLRLREAFESSKVLGEFFKHFNEDFFKHKNYKNIPKEKREEWQVKGLKEIDKLMTEEVKGL